MLHQMLLVEWCATADFNVASWSLLSHIMYVSIFEGDGEKKYLLTKCDGNKR